MPDWGNWGTLKMSEEPQVFPVDAVAWTDSPFVSTYIVACLVLLALSARDIAAVFFKAVESVYYWKQNIRIQESIHAVHSRTWSCICMTPPFLLVCAYYSENYLPFWGIPAIIACYFAVKEIAGLSYRMEKVDPLIQKSARRCSYNLYIPMTAMAVLTALICQIPGISMQAARIALLAQAALLLLAQIRREWEILRSAAGALPTFLYLCALEIAPLASAALIAYQIS